MFYEHQISAGQKSDFSSSTETIYCLNREAISLETQLISTRYKPRVNYNCTSAMFRALASNSYTLKINYTLNFSVSLLDTLSVGGKRIEKKVVRRKSGEVICRMQNAERRT